MNKKHKDFDVPWGEPADVIIARTLKETATARGEKPIADIGSTVCEKILTLLDKNGNYRSPEMQADMHKTAALMDSMVNGDCEAKYWVCDLPTGTGKTTLIAAYCGLLANKLPDDSVLICVPTLEEIEELVSRLTGSFGVKKSNIFVYTSKPDMNDLGCPEHQGSDAQICITTQQMVDSRLVNVPSFNALEIFKFKGEPRKLRLWDEAIIPWKEFMLTVDDISWLPRLIRNHYPELADRLHEVSADVRNCQIKTYAFPDLLSEHGYKHEDFKKDVLSRMQDSNEARMVIQTLIGLCGNKVRVTRDQNRNVVVSWNNHIPKDFLPVLIFDASGRARSMYDHYAASTANLEIFTSSAKRYDNVTFHHLNTPGSKTAWRGDPERLLQITAGCIENEPDRPCLVIHHMMEKTPRTKRGGMVPDIPAALKPKGSDVEFRHWGMHKHTNEYEDRDKLVLAGLFYLPTRAIEVRARGSNQLDAEEEVEDEKLRDIELGELRHETLQAVGRVCVRRSIKGDKGEAQAPKADVYIMASNKAVTSIPDFLRELFPGCAVENQPVPGDP